MVVDVPGATRIEVKRRGKRESRGRSLEPLPTTTTQDELLERQGRKVLRALQEAKEPQE